MEIEPKMGQILVQKGMMADDKRIISSLVMKYTAVLLPKALAPHSSYEELIIFKCSHSPSLEQCSSTTYLVKWNWESGVNAPDCGRRVD